MKTVIIALAMSMGLPGAAMAQNYPPASPESAATQEQLDHLHDHLEHDRQHQQIEDAHAREHASGFTSQAQHDEYHRQLEGLHGDVHEALPGTEHAHDAANYNGRSDGYVRQGYQGDPRYGTQSGYGDGYAQRRTTVTHYYGHRPTRYGRVRHHHTSTYSRVG